MNISLANSSLQFIRPGAPAQRIIIDAFASALMLASSFVASAEPVGFTEARPTNIKWIPFAAAPGAQIAVLAGGPNKPGLYAIRMSIPSDMKVMPHSHPEDRVYTVIAGTWYIGLGDAFDADKLQAYEPGSVVYLPGKVNHFHWAKSGSYITQIIAVGPVGLNYVNPTDDPRTEQAESAGDGPR